MTKREFVKEALISLLYIGKHIIKNRRYEKELQKQFDAKKKLR